MADIVFAQAVGLNPAVAAAAKIRSASVLDHSLHIAKADVGNQNFKADPALRQEITKLYNATVKDGRYVRDFGTDPEGVAAKMHMQLSPAAAAEIKKAGSLRGAQVSTPGQVMDTVDVICVAIIVVLCADIGPNEEIIVDRSGMIKY